MDDISKMLNVEGKDLIMITDQDGTIALYYTCMNSNISMDMLTKLLDIGGKELLIQKDDHGYTVLHGGLFHFNSNNCLNFNDSIMLLLKEYILIDTDGEFGFGRVFNFAIKEEAKGYIYERREELPLALQSILDFSQDHHNLPSSMLLFLP